jgi:hypothetical protein
MTTKEAKKLENLLYKSMVAMQEAKECSAADYLLIKQLQTAQDALRVAMETSKTTYAIANA